MHIIYAFRSHKIRTTLAIEQKLLEEARTLSGGKIKRQTVEKALEEFTKSKMVKKLRDLEARVELSFSLN